MQMPCIYHAYTMHIPCIYHAYITHSKVSDRGVDWHGDFPYATLLDASKGAW